MERTIRPETRRSIFKEFQFSFACCYLIIPQLSFYLEWIYGRLLHSSWSEPLIFPTVSVRGTVIIATTNQMDVTAIFTIFRKTRPDGLFTGAQEIVRSLVDSDAFAEYSASCHSLHICIQYDQRNSFVWSKALQSNKMHRNTNSGTGTEVLRIKNFWHWLTKLRVEVGGVCICDASIQLALWHSLISPQEAWVANMD